MCFNLIQLLMSKFKNGKPLIDIKLQNNDESVEVLDSDSDDEEKNDEFIALPGYDSLTANELEFVTEKLPDMMEEVSRNYKFDEQIQMCNELINNQAVQLESIIIFILSIFCIKMFLYTIICINLNYSQKIQQIYMCNTMH